MAIEGNLAHVGLADICQLLAMGRKTGCLSVSNRPAFGRIYFKKGRVIYASVVNRPDRLGTLLLRNELISQAQLDRAVEVQATEPDRKLGQILVDAGELSQDDLERYIKIQIEEAVYHLFGWNEGTFRFEPDEAPDDPQVMLVSINTEGLLLEGARRVDEWGLIEKKIPSLDLIFSVDRLPGGDDDVELTPNQQRILPFLDGDRTVEDIVDASGMVEFDAAKALYGLVQAGFVEKTGQRIREPEPEIVPADAGSGPAYMRTGMLDDAARALERVLEEDPDNQEARFKMAGVALRLGRFEEGLAHLDALDVELAGRPGVLRNRALALEKLGRLDEAESTLKALMEEGDEGGRAVLALAILSLRRGDVRAALKRLEKARSLVENGAPPPLYYGYGILAVAMDGDLEGSVALGQEGLERYPDDPVLMVNLGTVHLRLGHADTAEALFIGAVEQGQALPQAHKNLGDLAYHRGDYPGARTHYERALKLDPRLGDDVYHKLGDIACREDDLDWARMLWSRALELNPGNERVRASVEQLGAG